MIYFLQAEVKDSPSAIVPSAARVSVAGGVYLLGVLGFFALAAVMLFARAMGPGLNHDEHQFIAAGQLLAGQGAMPYRDYPFFHTPVLMWVYSVLFRQTDFFFLAARTCSAVCAWLSGVLIFAMAWRGLASQTRWWRLGIGCGLTALFFTNPIFTYAYFNVWNHALPVLLMLGAVFTHCCGARTGARGWFALSGLLIGLAMGTRLTFAPLGLPFLIMAGLDPDATFRQRVIAVLSFCGGLTIGLLPVMVSLVQAPEGFLFDNFVYNGPINSAFRAGHQGLGSPIESRFFFLLKVLAQPGNLALCVAFIYFAVARKIERVRWRACYPRALILALFPFALVGTFAPTPSYTQYFYPLVALGVAGVAFGLAERHVFSRRDSRILWFVIAISVPSTAYDYRYIFSLGVMKEWSPLIVHTDGEIVRSYVPGGGRILTLAPTIALEGGLEIYPQFASGPFAWRTAGLLTAEQRRHYGFVSEAELGNLLAAQPPAGILTGYEKTEQPLVDYAQAHDYREVKLSNRKVLWIPPH